MQHDPARAGFPLRYKLATPVERNGTVVTEVFIRQPTSGEMRRLGKANGRDVGPMLDLLADVTGLGAAFDHIAITDAMRICELMIAALSVPAARAAS